MDDALHETGLHPLRFRGRIDVTRREFLAAAGILALGACSDSTEPGPSGNPRLSARPSTSTPKTLAAGFHRVSPNNAELVAYVPASALTREVIPVMVFLHGALKTVEAFVEAHVEIADATGGVVLAPYALENTWDAIYYGFDVDVGRINSSLNWLFSGLPINPAAVALAGFSDGATYTLGLGRANGDLFTRLIAYSPGFLLPVAATGKPPIAISHGTQDNVLPYANVRDNIVPNLRAAGYSVDFRTFEIGHAVPASLVTDSMNELGSL